MRKLLILGLLALPSLCRAQTNVFETASGSATVTNKGVTVSSSASVQLDGGANAMATTPARRTALEVWNDDATNNCFCSFEVNVSSVPPTAALASPHYGRRVPPRSAWTVGISYQIPVYCIADSGFPVCVLTQIGAQ